MSVLSKVKDGLGPTYLLAFLGDINLSMIQVLSVLYGVMLGASPSQNGFIGGGYGLSYLLMAAFLGRLGDKIKRKYSLILALSFQLVISLYYIFFASNIIQLILGQIALGCAYGFFWPSLEAYISENSSASPIVHQKAISSFCIAWSLGYTLGPFLAGVLSDITVVLGFSMIFILYLIAFSILLVFIPSGKDNGNDSAALAGEMDFEMETKEQGNKKLMLRLLIGMVIYAMLGKVVLNYFADYASRPLGLGFTGAVVGFLLFSFGAGRTIYFILSRYIETSLNRLSYAYLITSLLLVFLTFMESVTIIFVIIFIFGIAAGLIYKSTLEILLLYEHEKKSTKAGLFESMIGIGSALSPIIAGYLAEISLIFPFFIYGLVASLIFLVNFLLQKFR
ncbi:MAG: MFS transporter [Promethearchaeia archaeon]